MNISIDAWKWLYENRKKIDSYSGKKSAGPVSTFMRSGLLLFEGDHFTFTAPLQKVLQGIKKEEKQLRAGVPLCYKQTTVNPKELRRHLWYKGKTENQRSFLTNYEIIIFASSFHGFTIVNSSDLMEVEILISQVNHAIFREDYIDVTPATLQREGYFSVGIIHLLGENGYKVSIDEGYYDLITRLWEKVRTPCRFVSTFVGKEVVVVLNPHVASRYLEDIIAIISPCSLEGL